MRNHRSTRSRERLRSERRAFLAARTVIGSLSFFRRTSAITDTCPWRDPCRERSDQAWSVTRVGVRWIALFALFLFCKLLDKVNARTSNVDGEILVLHTGLPRDQERVIVRAILRYEGGGVECALVSAVAKVVVNNRTICQLYLLIFQFRSCGDHRKGLLLESAMWHAGQGNAEIDRLAKGVRCKPYHFAL